MEDRIREEVAHEERTLKRMTEKKMAVRDIMTPEDLAIFMSISERMVVYYIQKGKIPAYRVGRAKYLISLARLLDFIEKNSSYPNRS